MSTVSIFEAIADVRELRTRILDKQIFRGYSGWTRITGGVLAILAAFMFSQSWYPQETWAHLWGWGSVCAVSAFINFAAVLHWRSVRGHNACAVLPLLDLVAPFVVGGLISVALVSRQQYDLLFSIWMWVFGIMNISSRHAMPRSMSYLGWFYIACGTIQYFLIPNISLFDPWFMGVTFFIGELSGGLIFIRLRAEK